MRRAVPKDDAVRGRDKGSRPAGGSRGQTCPEKPRTCLGSPPLCATVRTDRAAQRRATDRGSASLPRWRSLAQPAQPHPESYPTRVGKGWFLERRGLHCGAETGAGGKVWRRGLTASTHTSRGPSRARGYPTKADDARGPGGKPGKQAGGRRGWPRPDGRRDGDGMGCPRRAGRGRRTGERTARPGQARPGRRVGLAGWHGAWLPRFLPPPPRDASMRQQPAQRAGNFLSIAAAP